jgi:hypothetical protein
MTNSRNTQWDLNWSGISLSGYGAIVTKPNDRYSAWAEVMKSGAVALNGQQKPSVGRQNVARE